MVTHYFGLTAYPEGYKFAVGTNVYVMRNKVAIRLFWISIVLWVLNHIVTFLFGGSEYI